MWPKAPSNGEHELTLFYDRQDLGPFTERAAVEGVEGLLRLLGDPVWLENLSEGNGARPGFRPSISTWCLAWLAGLGQDDIRKYLDLLQWAGILSGDLSVVEAARQVSATTLAITSPT